MSNRVSVKKGASYLYIFPRINGPNDWSRMKQFIFFPENLNVARGEAEGNIERFVYKFMKINLASGQHSQVTVHCYPMTSS